MVRLGGFRRAGRRSSRSFGQQCARELEIRDLVSQTVECSSVVVVAWHPAFFAHILLAIHYPLPAAYCPMALSFVFFVSQVSLAQAFTPGTRETPPIFGYRPFRCMGDAALAPKGAEGDWECASVPQA